MIGWVRHNLGWVAGVDEREETSQLPVPRLVVLRRRGGGGWIAVCVSSREERRVKVGGLQTRAAAQRAAIGAARICLGAHYRPALDRLLAEVRDEEVEDPGDAGNAGEAASG